MKTDEKQEIIQTVAEAFEALILPHIDEMKERLDDVIDTMTRIENQQKEGQKVLDTHDRAIEDLQKRRPLAVV